MKAFLAGVAIAAVLSAASLVLYDFARIDSPDDNPSVHLAER